MHRLLSRCLIGATTLVVVEIGVVHSLPSDGDLASRTIVNAGLSGSSGSAPPLGQVTFHQLGNPPASSTESASATSSQEMPSSGLAQEVSVTIRPGGPLRVFPPRESVHLHRRGNQLVGALGPVEVVDPRGTLAGWDLRAALYPDSENTGLHLHVVPGVPHPIAGLEHGLVEGAPASLDPDGQVTLMRALPGDGGGSFSVTTTIVSSRARAVPRTVELEVDAS